MIKVSGLASGALKFGPIDGETNLGSLVRRIESEDSTLKSYSIQTGFPPRNVEGDASATLISLGVKGGDSLVLRKGDGHPLGKQEELSELSAGGMERYIIDADNSCLFNAVGFCLNGRLLSEASTLYRGYIAEEVLSNKSELYSEAMLGKSPQEYADWVQDLKHWGGEIEMSILCGRLAVRIVAVDVQTGGLYTYAPSVSASASQEIEESIYLMYDGIHYDAVVRRQGDGSMRTRFSSEREGAVVEAGCVELAATLRKERQYTDTKHFDLRCLVCNERLRGEAGARAHALETGHQNFGEA